MTSGAALTMSTPTKRSNARAQTRAAGRGPWPADVRYTPQGRACAMTSRNSLVVLWVYPSVVCPRAGGGEISMKEIGTGPHKI